MTYFESAEDMTVTKKRAFLELSRHNVSEDERPRFLLEMGDKEEYEAQDVLRWLGY